MPTIFKKPTISSKLINYHVILHYILLPIYPLHFPNFCPIQKHQKMLRNYRYLVKTTLAVLNLDHISRMYNQSNYRNIWFLKVIMILIMMARGFFFNDFSEKDPHLNAVDLVFIFNIQNICMDSVVAKLQPVGLC